MAEGNGVDLGAIHRMLAMVAVDVREMKQDRLDKSDLLGLRAEMGGIRQAIIQNHSTVPGHGIFIGEPEARVRRVEDHSHLPPLIAAA